MNSDLSKRALEIFEAAVEQEPSRRARFVAEACARDSGLRREVESLILSYEQAGSFLESPILEQPTAVRSSPDGSSLVGQDIGHYRILAPIGRGGMGEVHLAQDSRLGRRVALKLLRSDYTQDAERLARFQQEVRAASALNHPNILTIHEVGEHGTLHFMAAEYVKGQTLRELISSKGQLEVGTAIDVALQVASALSAAHEAGIVHRDIKPENVMLRPDGYVKVLDFGLAKLVERPKPVEDTEVPTFPRLYTEPGMVMGTAHYMSPEQARGLEVDARTDVFSLGVLLYELLAGRPPFQGKTRTDVLVALLEREPEALPQLRTGLPEALVRIVERCLTKDPDGRYASGSDLRKALEELKRSLESGRAVEAVPATPRRRVRWVLVAASASALLAAAAYTAFRAIVNSRDGPVEANFVQLTTEPGREILPSVSSDGKWFAYVSTATGNEEIYLRAVGGRSPLNLTQHPAADTEPASSPDGERIAFRSERDGGGIFVMGRTGESPRRLTDSGFNPAWSPDGQEVVYGTVNTSSAESAAVVVSELWVVKVSTGEKRRISAGDASMPHWSPHGARIAYMAWQVEPRSLDIWTVPAAGGPATAVTDYESREWNPVWSPDGKYIYFSSDRAGSLNLWRVPVDEKSGKPLGKPQAITAPTAELGHLSISADGRRLAYVSFENASNVQRVAWDPKRETTEGEPTWVTTGSFPRWTAGRPSPDGEWVAHNYPYSGIYLSRSDGTGLRQFTEGGEMRATWSPDAKRIAFVSDRSGVYNIWVVNIDGTGLEQLTDARANGDGGYHCPFWSPDGSRLVFHTVATKPPKAAMLRLEGPKKERVEPLPPVSPAGERLEATSWSPDSKMIAGVSMTEGGPEQVPGGIVVYSLATGRYEKLTDFGGNPEWLSDGRRLLFENAGKIYLLDVQTRRTREVLSLPAPDTASSPRLARDNRHIYFLRSRDEADIWLTELK